MNLKELIGVFRRYLYLEESTEQAIKVMMAVAVSNKLPDDPIWMFFVAPPGSTKTEMLRAFMGHPETVFLSNLTTAAFGSGMKTKKEDPSLATEVDGKILIIKDFTTILSLRPEIRNEILNIMRELYDGYYSKGFGIKGLQTWTPHFTCMAGVTYEIDKAHGVQTNLGERYLRFRIHYEDQDALIDQAQKIGEQQVEMRKEFQRAVRLFMDSHQLKFSELPTIPEDMIRRIKKLARFLAWGRTVVSRDRYTHAIDYAPFPEAGTRLIIQFTKLIRCLGYVAGKTEVGEEEYAIVQKIAIDGIPTKTYNAIQLLYDETKLYPQTTEQLGDRTDTDTRSMHAILDDLKVLKIVEKTEKDAIIENRGRGDKWRMTNKFRVIIDNTSLNHPPPEPIEPPKQEDMGLPEEEEIPF